MDGLDRGADDLSRAKRAGRRLRRHWLFATLLILAAALRAVGTSYFISLNEEEDGTSPKV